MSDNVIKTPAHTLSSDMLELCRSVKSKRPRTVIEHILKHGIVTNEELHELYGYEHPPRAIRDVRENGIPLITHQIINSKTGRKTGAYTFGDVSQIKKGRIGGRRAFPKELKKELLDLYGSRDAFTLSYLPERYLQIDHRIPYEISGDGDQLFNPMDFMLLDASSNRRKSWSCEQCENFLKNHQIDICKTCFWAFPENYTHVAGEALRRIDLLWTGNETSYYDTLCRIANTKKINPQFLIKKIICDFVIRHKKE